MNTFFLVLGLAAGSLLLIWMALLSGRKYTVHDTEAHSTNYADVIKEGHGGLTLFLWFCFAVIFIFTIVYLVQHWSEFSMISS